jgi:hypothetical protein
LPDISKLHKDLVAHYFAQESRSSSDDDLRHPKVVVSPAIEEQKTLQGEPIKKSPMSVQNNKMSSRLDSNSPNFQPVSKNQRQSMHYQPYQIQYFQPMQNDGQYLQVYPPQQVKSTMSDHRS